MTIVVGIQTKDKVYLAADSQGSAGSDKTMRKDPKVFIVHGIGYGFTSSYRMGQILRYHSEECFSELRKKDVYGYVVTCLVPMWRRILKEHGFTKISDNEETGGQFLIGIDGQLFSIDDDFQVGEPSLPFDAVGCGASYALGYLFGAICIDGEVDRGVGAMLVAKYSIHAAIQFSNGCSGDIKTICV